MSFNPDITNCWGLFVDRIISKFGNNNWWSRSHDVHLGFCLLGYVKDRVWGNKWNNHGIIKKRLKLIFDQDNLSADGCLRVDKGIKRPFSIIQLLASLKTIYPKMSNSNAELNSIWLITTNSFVLLNHSLAPSEYGATSVLGKPWENLLYINSFLWYSIDFYMIAS